MKKTNDRNNGITLIALVITIIVMLILVVVTISMAINRGIFDYAGRAKKETENAIGKEQELALGDLIDKWVNGNGPVTNPYNPNDWEMAWTCTNGTWSKTILKGNLAEGQIVAKLYKTGEKIKPNFSGQSLSEGDAYALVIEGNGEMGALVDMSQRKFLGWLGDVVGDNGQLNYNWVGWYLTDVIICDNVTTIGLGAFGDNPTIQNVTISSSVVSIEDGAFGGCSNLSSITIPNTVTNIGENAFLDVPHIYYNGTATGAPWGAKAIN